MLLPTELTSNRLIHEKRKASRNDHQGKLKTSVMNINNIKKYSYSTKFNFLLFKQDHQLKNQNRPRKKTVLIPKKIPTGSTWQSDPITMPPTLVLNVDEATREIYKKHWRQLRTRFSRRNKVQDWYNFLVQMLVGRLLKFLDLDKVTQRSFAEYLSKRNFVERVHTIENKVLSDHGPFSSKQVHEAASLGSKEHTENMEVMANDVVACIRKGIYNKEPIRCFRGVGESNHFLFNDEQELKSFSLLSDERKEEDCTPKTRLWSAVSMASGRVFLSSAILLFLLEFSFFTGLSGQCFDHQKFEGIFVINHGLHTSGCSAYFLAGYGYLTRPRGRRYFSTRICLYSNAYITFKLERLAISGDINPNPGPTSSENSTKTLCSACMKTVAKNDRAIECDICSKWCHIKCGGVSPT